MTVQVDTSAKTIVPFMVVHDAQYWKRAAGKNFIIEPVGFLVARPEETPIPQNNMAADIIKFVLPVFNNKISFSDHALFLHRISVKIT